MFTIAPSDVLELTEENIERVLDEVTAAGGLAFMLLAQKKVPPRIANAAILLAAGAPLPHGRRRQR